MRNAKPAGAIEEREGLQPSSSRAPAIMFFWKLRRTPAGLQPAQAGFVAAGQAPPAAQLALKRRADHPGAVSTASRCPAVCPPLKVKVHDGRDDAPQPHATPNQRPAQPRASHIHSTPVRDAVGPFVRAWRGQGLRQLSLGLLLACLALGASIGLLGLSGWFIATSALVSLLSITTFSFLIPSAGIRALALLRIGSRYGERVVLHRATFTWLARLRTALFAHATRLPPAVMARFRSADVMDRALGDVDTLDQSILRVLAPTLSAALIALGCLLLLAAQSAGVAVLVAGIAVAAGIGLPALMSRLGRTPGIQQADARARLRTELIEALEGSREIATYGAEDAVRSRLLVLLEESDHAQARVRRLSAAGGAASLLLSGAALAGALALGLVNLTARGPVGAPAVAVIALITVGLFEAIEALPPAYQQMGAVRRAARRINGLFGLAVTDATPLGAPSEPFPPHAALSLRAVSFTYATDDVEPSPARPVIQDVSLTLPAGAFVTLLGPSGAGKTTLLKLIAGEVTPRAGQVVLGATPLPEIAAVEFWRHTGYVAQDSHIFTGTVRDNLLLAAPRATDAALLDALAAVGLAELVASRDGGLDTALGEEGDRLSGGQRRRLCLARALLRQPDLLLLDEPTAGVDRDTAERMLTAIRQRLPASTILVATHDPLPATLADIVVTIGAVGRVSTHPGDTGDAM